MMADDPYMSTTQPTQAQSSGAASFGFSTDYLMTIPGKLKCAQLLLSIIVFICAQAGQYYSGVGWVSFVGISAFLGTLVLFLMHLFGVLNRRGRFTLRLIIPEFIYQGIETVLFITAAITATVSAGRSAGAAAAAVFSLLAVAAYAMDTFIQYKSWKAERQREETLVTQSAAVDQQVPPGLPPKYEA